MLAKTYTAAEQGIEAFIVEVEVNASGKGEQDYVSIVGLPDASVKESRDRIRSALQSAGLPHPKGATIVNLAPADLKKEGAAFDLAIASAILGAAGLLNRSALSRCALLGELALDGSVRSVKGALVAAAKLAAEPGLRALLVPAENAQEAAFSAGNLPVHAVKHLTDVIRFCEKGEGTRVLPGRINELLSGGEPDFADIKGQSFARRAMEIAAAGFHNTLMVGSPGTGKSMLASRLPGILPPLTMEERLECSRIYSVMGLLGNAPLVTRRPFRAPHHTISDVALIGGGRTDIRPGEISLAHHGVLFLDELPEFKRNVLEVLRQPLENGSVNIGRASGSCTFPAAFMLIAAMNPCPCGRGDAELGCRCKEDEKRRYRRKVSGPLLDRIDLQLEVGNLSQEELLRAPNGESSAAIRARVVAAREFQLRRFAGRPFSCNSRMTSADLQKFCVVTPGSQKLLIEAIRRFHLSPRAYDRILKVARTIADLAGSPDIAEAHLFEAVSYRTLRFEE